MQIKSLKRISHLVINQLNQAFLKQFPQLHPQSIVQNQMKKQYDYLSPSAIKYFNIIKNKKNNKSFEFQNVSQFSKKIIAPLNNNNPYIMKGISNQQGFIQIFINNNLIQEQINNILKNGFILPNKSQQIVVVDYSSPNIAKQMHVGHLRSTIIGQSISRVLQFVGNKVHRISHEGDWGTQFGMLITYLEQNFPNYLTEKPQIQNLDQFYKLSRQQFDKNPDFKKKSQLKVVDLQKHDEECKKAWQIICEISHKSNNKIYQRLNINLTQQGQSFYNQMIPEVIQQLKAKEMLKQSEGAHCIYSKKYPTPLIVVKKDGGYNYDSTDLACIKYRLQTLKADRIIYVVDSGQAQHFQMIFEAAKNVGWITNQRIEHMGFGLVLGEDGKKFSSRKKTGETAKLMELLEEAKQQALIQLKLRQKEGLQKKQNQQNKQTKQFKDIIFTTGTNLKPQQFQQAAQKLGMASVKYFDMRQNRISNYKFSYKKMLDPRGNTAVYLIYAYVRLCSIIKKSGYSQQKIIQLIQKQGFKITHQDERKLAANVIKFTDVIFQVSEQLAINKQNYIIDQLILFFRCV